MVAFLKFKIVPLSRKRVEAAAPLLMASPELTAFLSTFLPDEIPLCW